ncbi:LysR family transcriptional regulator [Mycobacterium sp. 236(2023)]|uniref:LysR family transcriptional regulator n=1 Tax=Mycobacterium sp. 236(2023) TaxID=3038163 RepID=UPI0024153E5C|nr:LysR family transcriptional regulator [Mycobacterium sp. 236(2023)]MDG4663218.1 LysR family transcriptional regulator [Mycobacterium sp. 236(2023)]
MAITLDQVRCFVAVAEELHFGKAAERLAMTQPPLSRQIQRLERAVGAGLLDRDNRRVVLTPAGLAFLEDCYRVLSSLDGATAHAQRVERGSAGTLRLGFTAVSAIGLVGPLLGLLGNEMPDIEVVLQEAVTGIQVDGIRRGELDLGLARPPFDTAALESKVVAREALLAVVPASHPLAAEAGPLGPDAFDGLSVISYHPQRAQYFHELTVRFLFNGHPRITQRVQQILTAVLLVAAGQGVALVPASARALRVDGVAFKALTDFGSGHRDSDPARPVELHAIWARGSLSPMLRQVLELVERSAVHLDEIGD